MSSSCTDKAVISSKQYNCEVDSSEKFQLFCISLWPLDNTDSSRVGPRLSLNLAFVNMSHEQLVSRISVKAGSLVATIANSWLACLQRKENKSILCLNKPTKSLLRIFQLSQPVYMAISSTSGAVGCVSDDSKQLNLISSLA